MIVFKSDFYRRDKSIFSKKSSDILSHTVGNGKTTKIKEGKSCEKKHIRENWSQSLEHEMQRSEFFNHLYHIKIFPAVKSKV